MALKTQFLVTGLKAIIKDWKNLYSEDLHLKAKNELF